MLKVVYASCPQAKESFFLSHKSQEDLWLVSHVEAKKTLQAIFLEAQNTISNNSVLRASEYWQWLFSVNCPDWRSVSESLVYTLIEQWFDEGEVDVRYQNLEMFRNFFGHALPLMTEENAPLLEEWLTSDGQRDERLAGWFEQAAAFWEFLREKKWIGRSWAINILNQREALYFGDSRSYFVDLGLDLRQEEVEMILRLAQEKDVTVLIPQTVWSPRYSQSLDIYKKIIDRATATETLAMVAKSVPAQLSEYSSVLKETKSVVASVRALLDQGVRPAQIAVVSSNIEDYWDMLREHFLVEGVPVNKNSVLRTISLPSVQGWLARLNLARRDFEQSHLETYLYSAEDAAPAKPYAAFKKDFSHVYEVDEVRDIFKLPSGKKSSETLSMAEFVEFIMTTWRGESREIADGLIDEMAKELRSSDTMTYDLWLKYLELVISRQEIPVRAADESGLILANFNQADWTTVDHAFVLGCEQSRLREITANPLSGEDIARIELDLGFYLQRNESLKKEFELRWFCEKTLQSLTLSHSHSDFDGQPQIAASLWLELQGSQTKPPADDVRTPRWDQVMASGLDVIQSELKIDVAERTMQQKKLALENQLDGYELVKARPAISLSAGSLKKFFDCPFVFYAEKILKLKDQNEFDLDIDPMFQGQIWHKIVEDIHKTHDDLNVSKDELSRLYDTAVETLDVDSPLRRFWLQEKPRHLLIMQNFLDLEKEWRAKFPKIATVATEAGVKGFIGLVDEEVIVSTEQHNDSFYPFNGRVDRIDRDETKHLAVVDYKTSQAGLKAFKNWPQNGQFQMPLYALAIEAGLCEDIDTATVMSASYFIFKEKKRGLGYIIKDQEHGFGDLKEKSSQLVGTEDRDAVFDAVLEEIKKIFVKLRQGFFPPAPRDQKMCFRCNWRELCRAPHLK